MLLIHGFTLTWQCWGAVIDELSGDLDVLASTLSGHRGGPEPDGPLTMAGLAGFLQRQMDTAGWLDPHVAGNSLGGWLALELAARGR
ncbi:alpha/beta fold hydrolase [Nocardia gamkensis]|uniref:alpha/beta fold hydrolase n=1 Tax=Nocardia gamkensis TaxID=352869 RepID=UPI0037C8A63C